MSVTMNKFGNIRHSGWLFRRQKITFQLAQLQGEAY